MCTPFMVGFSTSSQDADYFCALGDVDELNSTVGAAREFCGDKEEHRATAVQLEGRWWSDALNGLI